MELTKSQCELMINILNASIEHSMKSGIPIGQEYYYDLEKIKEELYKELAELSTKKINNYTW